MRDERKVCVAFKILMGVGLPTLPGVKPQVNSTDSQPCITPDWKVRYAEKPKAKN